MFNPEAYVFYHVPTPSYVYTWVLKSTSFHLTLFIDFRRNLTPPTTKIAHPVSPFYSPIIFVSFRHFFILVSSSSNKAKEFDSTYLFSWRFTCSLLFLWYFWKIILLFNHVDFITNQFSFTHVKKLGQCYSNFTSKMVFSILKHVCTKFGKKLLHKYAKNFSKATSNLLHKKNIFDSKIAPKMLKKKKQFLHFKTVTKYHKKYIYKITKKLLQICKKYFWSEIQVNLE